MAVSCFIIFEFNFENKIVDVDRYHRNKNVNIRTGLKYINELSFYSISIELSILSFLFYIMLITTLITTAWERYIVFAS